MSCYEAMSYGGLARRRCYLLIFTNIIRDFKFKFSGSLFGQPRRRTAADTTALHSARRLYILLDFIQSFAEITKSYHIVIAVF